MPKTRIDENIVLQAALEEFTSYSFEEASLNRIIKNAGISKGSFYYRYETKYDIYLHLLKEGMKKKWDFIRTELEGAQSKSQEEDIFSLFLKQTEMGLRFAHSFPQYHKLAKMFSREKGSEVYHKALENMGQADDSQLESLIDAAIQRGDLTSRFSNDFITKLLSYLFQNYDEFVSDTVDEDLNEALNKMKDFTDFLKYGLAGEMR